MLLRHHRRRGIADVALRPRGGVLSETETETEGAHHPPLPVQLGHPCRRARRYDGPSQAQLSRTLLNGGWRATLKIGGVLTDVAVRGSEYTQYTADLTGAHGLGGRLGILTEWVRRPFGAGRGVEMGGRG